MPERRILVVEDSPTQAQRLQLVLEDAGYRVHLARNGREALQRVEADPPDLIISDVMMPEMDGYAFCRAVKSQERLRRIPVVLLTERRSAADVIMGLERGADNFILKPFEDRQLLDRLGRIFENLELRRQGRLDMEITLNVGPRQIVINTDKQQIVELLFATLEELGRTNAELEQSQRAVEEYARSLEEQVSQRSQQLMQAEKVATMGHLQAGVAHELNNPLSVVVGQLELLAGTRGAPEAAHRLERASQAAERCARIVKTFLALARQRPPARQTVWLNQVVNDALELVAYPLRVDGIEVVLRLEAELPAVHADPDQMHQVVVNILTNAHDALRAHGGPRRIGVTTRHELARRQVMLVVDDSGPGIPEEVRCRVFEPFFTTKPQGKGTGLGLPLCQGIVESHGGTIAVDSAPGRGTAMTVTLPVEEAPAAPAAVDAGGEAATAGPRCVLVVDDEPEVAELLADFLSGQGHTVDTAGSGLEALERVEGRDYDVILSDIRMPGLDGPNLYRELKRRRPALAARMIFVTGDALSPEVARFLAEAGVPSVGKPFDLREIARAVRAAGRATSAT